LKAVRAELLRTVLRIAGGLSAIVGALGTAFHVSAFMRLLEGQEVTWKAIELALAVAPPLAAPGAFIAVGGLLMLLASPRVELSAGASDTEAWLRVQDACGGIPDADLERIFDVGYRGAAARTPGAESGAGLGLAIARALTEAHGGLLTVQNAGPGCRFELTLPQRRPARSPVRTP